MGENGKPTGTPKLINEPDLLVDGFHKLDDHVLDAKAPKIVFLKGFHVRSPERQIEYLVKLASTMNHAAKLIQDERDKLIPLLVKKDEQLKMMAAQIEANNSMLQSEVTKMNEQRQGYHAEVVRLNARYRELFNRPLGKIIRDRIERWWRTIRRRS